MMEKINSPVSVIMDFNHHQRKLRPMQIQWNNRDWRVEAVGLHHQYYSGRKLVHIFSVTANGMFFKLELDTQSLFWKLLEVADGSV
jgi:hypothetical protein